MHEVTNIVQDLIATCRDSEEGFGKAAKGVHSDNLRHRFTGIARQRADFADELGQWLSGQGIEPPQTGHQSGIQERGWRELEVRIRPKDDYTFLQDCENGEEHTLRHYEQALTQDLPPALRPVVDRHRLAVQEALLEIRDLEQLRKAS